MVNNKEPFSLLVANKNHKKKRLKGKYSKRRGESVRPHSISQHTRKREKSWSEIIDSGSEKITGKPVHRTKRRKTKE